MNAAVSVSRIGVSSFRPVAAGWSEIRPQDVDGWNHALFQSRASLYQYPFWNEPYRRLWVTPRYLVWGRPQEPLAFASILTIGVGPAKIGLVFRGPAVLSSDVELWQTVFRKLLDWANAQGYMFLRFTHSDRQIVTEIAAAGHTLNVDAFPYLQDYPVLSQDYLVRQYESDEQTLDSFDREVRRKIRRALEAGYEFHCQDSPNALERIWPLYQECARRKGFRLERPLSFYMDLMRGAQSFNGVRLYTVELKAAVVGSTLVFRERGIAHCQLAAFAAEHRHAAVLLHWRSMRDMYRLGARSYNLGPGPGSLARFKSQFCPNPVTYPAPLTVILKEGWFRVWQKAFLPIAKQVQPVLRGIAFRRAALGLVGSASSAAARRQEAVLLQAE